MRAVTRAAGGFWLVLGSAAAVDAGGQAAFVPAPGFQTAAEVPGRAAGAESAGGAPVSMATFKARMSGTYSAADGAFVAMQQQALAERQPGDGQSPGLSLEEFVTGTQSFNPPLGRGQAEFAFRGLDSDGNGELRKSEFLETLWTGVFRHGGGDTRGWRPREEDATRATAAAASAGATTPARAAATSATATTTAGPSAGAYRATGRVVQQEGRSLGDHTDRYYTVQECKVLCNRALGCQSFSYFDGNCHLKDRCVHASDPLVQQSNYRTYYKDCHRRAYRYAKLGPGYCSAGYYAGGKSGDAASVAVCQARCSAEPQCRFISLHLGNTCSRYTSKAGNCMERPKGQQDHVSYRREAAAPAAADSNETARPAVLDGRETPQPVAMGSSEIAKPAAANAGPSEKNGTVRARTDSTRAPITMAEFKARMLRSYASPLQAFQAMGKNPARTEDFLREVATYQPPLTLEQASYAFRGLDPDHDGLLRSFEFFEVIECGHFYPTAGELRAIRKAEAALVANVEAERAPWVLQAARDAPPPVAAAPGARERRGPPTPLLASIFGLLTCCCGTLLGMGLHLFTRAQDGAHQRSTYTAVPGPASPVGGAKAPRPASNKRLQVSL